MPVHRAVTYGRRVHAWRLRPCGPFAMAGVRRAIKVVGVVLQVYCSHFLPSMRPCSWSLLMRFSASYRTRRVKMGAARLAAAVKASPADSLGIEDWSPVFGRWRRSQPESAVSNLSPWLWMVALCYQYRDRSTESRGCRPPWRPAAPGNPDLFARVDLSRRGARLGHWFGEDGSSPQLWFDRSRLQTSRSSTVTRTRPRGSLGHLSHLGVYSLDATCRGWRPRGLRFWVDNVHEPRDPAPDPPLQTLGMG